MTTPNYLTCPHLFVTTRRYSDGSGQYYAVCDACGMEGPDKNCATFAHHGFLNFAVEVRQRAEAEAREEVQMEIKGCQSPSA